RQARAMLGWSLRVLAERLQGKISHTTIDQLENGERVPGSDVLLALAECLEQDLDFFFRPPRVQLGEIDFRKKANFGKKEITKVREEAAVHFERYLELEELCGDNKSLRSPLGSRVVTTDADLDRAALDLRQHWKLGLDPIPNVLELLEQHGLKVHLLEGPDKFSGFSGRAGNIPIMVLNKAQPADRLRFTALHELGHILLDLMPGMDEENACHRFAGSLLMPTDVCRQELRSHRSTLSIPELLILKRRWGMSMAAIARRAQQSGVLSLESYRTLARNFAIRGWRTREPGEVVPEVVNRFDRLLFGAISEGIITLSKASELSGKSLEELRTRLQGAE
ncbi:MAG TPA: XRE family transcriptional regulator, partial [Fibrobacteria bacterium]|nr:XRE family transcriptional regulator [Fibrobacteria bacterium]